MTGARGVRVLQALSDAGQLSLLAKESTVAVAKKLKAAAQTVKKATKQVVKKAEKAVKPVAKVFQGDAKGRKKPSASKKGSTAKKTRAKKT